MSKLAHYIIGFTNSKGEPKIHDGWIPEQDISKQDGLNKVKSQLLCDYFSLDSEERAQNLDAFEDASVIEAQANPQAQVIDQNAGLAIRPPGGVVLSKAIQRWDVDQGEEDALPNEPQYNVVIKESGSQIYIDVVPAGFSVDDIEKIENLPQMSIFLEINHGLPCIHLHGDIHGELAQTIFAEPNGKLGVRPGDAAGNVEQRPKFYEPNTEAMSDFIEQVKSENKSNFKQEKLRD